MSIITSALPTACRRLLIGISGPSLPEPRRHISDDALLSQAQTAAVRVSAESNTLQFVTAIAVFFAVRQLLATISAAI